MFLKEEWEFKTCWIASFDILGFLNLIQVDTGTFAAAKVLSHYQLAKDTFFSTHESAKETVIEFQWFSDTFIMHTKGDTYADYQVLQGVAAEFIQALIYVCIPIRGAISFGGLIVNKDGRTLMGNGFADAYKYGEAQNWLGLILTPTAVAKVTEYGAKPEWNDFVFSDHIPMKQPCDDPVMAYRFPYGTTGTDPVLLGRLEKMMRSSDKKYQEKYSATINFIKMHAGN